jgi:hypothetical protein
LTAQTKECRHQLQQSVSYVAAMVSAMIAALSQKEIQTFAQKRGAMKILALVIVTPTAMESWPSGTMRHSWTQYGLTV